MRRSSWLFVLIGIGMVFLAATATAAQDWPQWQGVNRDGKSVETGFLKTWPAGGLKLLWKTGKLGDGYAGVSIVGNRLYAMGGLSDTNVIMLYFREEQSGAMVLVEAVPTGYSEKGRLEQPDRAKEMAWPHPVIAHGKLYLRDQDNLFCYDLKAEASDADRNVPRRDRRILLQGIRTGEIASGGCVLQVSPPLQPSSQK